jgi:hypothetical protein
MNQRILTISILAGRDRIRPEGRQPNRPIPREPSR